MKQRNVYVYSSLNGALTKALFKRSFTVRESSALLTIGSIVRPAHLLKHFDRLATEGVVTHAAEDKGTQTLGVAMSASTEELRILFVPEGWKEVSGLME